MIRCTVALNIRGSDMQMRPNHANRKHGDERNKRKHPAVRHPNSNAWRRWGNWNLPASQWGKVTLGFYFAMLGRKNKTFQRCTCQFLTQQTNVTVFLGKLTLKKFIFFQYLYLFYCTVSRYWSAFDQFNQQLFTLILYFLPSNTSWLITSIKQSRQDWNRNGKIW